MGDTGNLKSLFKKAEPFIAVGILIMLIILGVLLFREQQLKKEINENCGWGEEDYYCFCEKSEAMEVRNKMESSGRPSLNIGGLNLENVSLVE